MRMLRSLASSSHSRLRERPPSGHYGGALISGPVASRLLIWPTCGMRPSRFVVGRRRRWPLVALVSDSSSAPVEVAGPANSFVGEQNQLDSLHEHCLGRTRATRAATGSSGPLMISAGPGDRQLNEAAGREIGSKNEISERPTSCWAQQLRAKWRVVEILKHSPAHHLLSLLPIAAAIAIAISISAGGAAAAQSQLARPEAPPVAQRWRR